MFMETQWRAAGITYLLKFRAPLRLFEFRPIPTAEMCNSNGNAPSKGKEINVEFCAARFRHPFTRKVEG